MWLAGVIAFFWFLSHALVRLVAVQSAAFRAEASPWPGIMRLVLLSLAALLWAIWFL